MKHRKLLISLTVAVLAGGLAYWHYLSGMAAEPINKLSTPVAKKYQETTIPTLLIPGWGGGANAYNQMITDWQTRGIAGKVLQAQISPRGHVTFHGNWNSHNVNPIIQVVFDWNFTDSYHAQVNWLANLLVALKKTYGVTEYNAVAHSWGGSALLTTVLLHGQAATMPRVHHLVFIGTPAAENVSKLNQLNANGTPIKVDATYQKLLANRSHLATNQQAAVTNIYGTVGNRATDTAVPVAQALTLRPLFKASVADYHEIHAVHTNHHQLHTSKRMATLIAQQLFGKWPITSAKATVFER